MLCLETVYVVETKVSHHGHVHEQECQDDSEVRVLAVDAMETPLQDGHGGVPILQDALEVRLVGGVEVGHVDNTVLTRSLRFADQLEKGKSLNEQKRNTDLFQ